MPEPERIDRRRAALVAYDVCRRALVPSDPARRAAMRPVLDAWVQMIAAARGAGVPVIYNGRRSRAINSGNARTRTTVRRWWSYPRASS